MNAKTERDLRKRGFTKCQDDTWIDPQGSLVKITCDDEGNYTGTSTYWEENHEK